MTYVNITANKDFAFPHLEMHQDTYKSLFNYFRDKMFKPSVHRKATWTLKINRYIITLCVLYGLETPTRRRRSINTEMLRGFIGYAGSSSCLKTSLNDFVSFGILENNFEYNKEYIKYRLNIDHEIFKLFKVIEYSDDFYSLEINPDDVNPLVTAEYIIKEWNKNNKSIVVPLPLPPVAEPAQAKVKEPEPSKVEEPVEEEQPEDDFIKLPQCIQLPDITGTNPDSKFLRDTVALLTIIYNMKKAGYIKTYNDATALYNAHSNKFREYFPNATASLTPPSVADKFKTWEREDGNCGVRIDASLLSDSDLQSF